MWPLITTRRQIHYKCNKNNKYSKKIHTYKYNKNNKYSKKNHTYISSKRKNLDKESGQRIEDECP